MSIEEKAKAYDEALERAKAYHRNELAGSRKEMMEYIFPELRESEDELTRQEMIAVIRSISSDCQFAIYLTDDQKQRYLAYLEKQKEQKPKAKAKSPLSPHELYDAKIDGISQGRQDVLDHPEKFGLQKEQEPQVFCEAKAYDLGYKQGKEDAKNEQKPAEWSEEDEKMRINILNALTPQLVYSVGKGTYTGTSTYKYDDEIRWLKSLRPQPHWKPSEEDEAAFEYAKENGTIGLDYDAVYDAFKAGVQWMKKQIES